MCPNCRRNKYLQKISKCVQTVVEINIYKKISKCVQSVVEINIYKKFRNVSKLS